MFYGGKLKRVIDLKETDEYYNGAQRENLEKGDRLALFLSALIVFGPILLIFGLSAVALMLLK